jgi:hypothetical protein
VPGHFRRKVHQRRTPPARLHARGGVATTRQAGIERPSTDGYVAGGDVVERCGGGILKGLCPVDLRNERLDDQLDPTRGLAQRTRRRTWGRGAASPGLVRVRIEPSPFAMTIASS